MVWNVKILFFKYIIKYFNIIILNLNLRFDPHFLTDKDDLEDTKGTEKYSPKCS